MQHVSKPHNTGSLEAGRPKGKTGAPRESKTDTIVIGGGQAGLTVSYLLKTAGRDYVVLDAHPRIGDAWRKRWDSLVLFTPNRFNSLPGLRFPGKRDHFTTKDEMADYLEAYAEQVGIDVRLDTRVTKVRRDGAGFIVATNRGNWRANNVVVAMADLQAPKVPDFADDLDSTINQCHSHDFTSAEQLADGPVLIVGLGNSGADIAMDVSRTHDTIVAGTPSAVVPFRIEPWFARNVLISIVRFVGLHVLNRRHPIGKRVIPKAEVKGKPLVRVKEYDLDAATRRVGRIVGTLDGKPATEEREALDVANVIWCTGYRRDWSWIDAGARDNLGRPLQKRGVVVDVPGLYMVGQEFLFAAASDTVTGHQLDARHVVRHLRRHAPPQIVSARGDGSTRTMQAAVASR